MSKIEERSEAIAAVLTEHGSRRPENTIHAIAMFDDDGKVVAIDDALQNEPNANSDVRRSFSQIAPALINVLKLINICGLRHTEHQASGLLQDVVLRFESWNILGAFYDDGYLKYYLLLISTAPPFQVGAAEKCLEELLDDIWGVLNDEEGNPETHSNSEYD